MHLEIKDDTGERRFDLLDAMITIGRAPENMIIVNDKESSRRQCQIERVDAGFKLVDLESRNGTRVNGKYVNQHLLRAGDKIQIGKCSLVYVDPQASPTADPAPAAIKISEPPSAAPAPSSEETRGGTKAGESGGVSRRRGTTTGISRMSRRRSGEFEKSKEQRMVKTFVVFALFFFALIFGLIFIGMVTGKPADYPVKEGWLREVKDDWENRPEFWKKRMEEVHTGYGEELHSQAKAMLAKIDDRLKSRIREAEGEEKALFFKLDEYRNKHGLDYDEIEKLCREYLDKFPEGVYAANVAEYAQSAKDGRRRQRDSHISGMNDSVNTSLGRDEYATAMNEVSKALRKYKNDVDVHERIVRTQSRIITGANAFFDKKSKEAEDLKLQGRKNEARMVYRDVIEALGAERVAELRDLCRRAHAKLQTIED